MSNRIPDNIAACRRIKSIRTEEREYARRTRKVKSITTRLEIINGYQLSAGLVVSFNTKTDAVWIQSNSLVFRKHRIHPGIHGKRSCRSEKALKMLEDARRYSREGSRRRRSKP